MSFKLWFKTEPGTAQEYAFIDEDYYFSGSLNCSSKKEVEKILFNSKDYETLDLDNPRRLNIGDIVLDLDSGVFWMYTERGIWATVKTISGAIEKDDDEEEEYKF